MSPENFVFDNAFLTIVFEDSEEEYYEIILDDFNYSVASESELLTFSDLTSMLEDSNDESGPVLITGAIAELRISDDE